VNRTTLLAFIILLYGLIATPCGAQTTLEVLENQARTHNPTLLQARAIVRGEQQKARQAGLWPNPIIGYIGDQFGLDDAALGEFQGGFIRQKIITGGKLRLSKQKYLARATAAQKEVLAQVLRIINDVRIHYYRTVGARMKVDIQKELLKTAQDNLVTVKELFNVGQANRADLDLAEAMLEEQKLKVLAAENTLFMERMVLESVIGTPIQTSFIGVLPLETETLSWEASLKEIVYDSPLIESARHKLQSDVITIEREKRQPIPDLTLEGGLGGNPEDKSVVYFASASINLPIFDRNQGTIEQAKADLARQTGQIELLKLQFKQLLAIQYQQYLTRKQHIEAFVKTIIPKFQSRYVVTLQSYKEDRATWESVLQTQADYFNHRLALVDHQVHYQESVIAIKGYLLVNGLMAPDGVTPPGHIDSVPKPR